jgi:hypothetical protein
LACQETPQACSRFRPAASGSFAISQKGAFSQKASHATEWRLNWWGCDVTGELASKKFMSWGREKQNAVSNQCRFAA